MSPHDKPLVWLHGVIATPPFSAGARVEAGFLLRMLQKGIPIGLPHSRPMPAIAPGCHELRINDQRHSWRIVYAVTRSSVVILDVFEKKTQATPKDVLELCRRRLGAYRKLSGE